MNTKKQIIRFLIAGTIVNATDFSIYYILFHFLPFSVSKGISFTCAGILGYLFYKYWIFKNDKQSYAEIGQADAFFSAGNTGAVVCAGTLGLGLLSGIERPGIGIVTPTLKGNSLIIDVGANIDPKPIQLLQYGIMADAYSKNILNKVNPSVGLLNIGEEEKKGTE